jgi:hypothetical protein
MRLLATLAFTLFTVPLTAQQSSAPAVLPSVTAYALDRSKVTLPADFAAPLNLLILSFQPDQESVVEGWLPVVNPGATPEIVQTWHLPISQRENGLYRWWLNASLRGSLPPSQPRRYTVPLYVNEPQFLRSLQVYSEKEVVLLLTDKTGRVLWRASGAVTDGKRTALTSFLMKAAQH